MKMYYEGGAYLCVPSSKTDDELARSAGLAWDRRRRVWHTSSATVASRLIQFAPPTLAARLRPLVEAAELSSAADADLDVPTPVGKAYLPFQRAGIAAILKRWGDPVPGRK